jgi:hypothetical protein
MRNKIYAPPTHAVRALRRILSDGESGIRN